MIVQRLWLKDLPSFLATIASIRALILHKTEIPQTLSIKTVAPPSRLGASGCCRLFMSGTSGEHVRRLPRAVTQNDLDLAIDADVMWIHNPRSLWRDFGSEAYVKTHSGLFFFLDVLVVHLLIYIHSININAFMASFPFVLF